MISKLHCRKMSKQIINVSNNFNNYKRKNVRTKCFLWELFSWETLPPSSLPSHFFICLEKFKNLKSCHATSNSMTRENCERCMIFLFNAWSCGWATKVKGKWQCDWKCHSCLELTGFWAQPAKIHLLYRLCETYLPSQTGLPSKSQLPHGFCYFLLCFICQSLFHYWYFQLLWLLL